MNLKEFFALDKDLPPDAGFDLFGREHIFWLCFAAVLIAVICVAYRRRDEEGRRKLRIFMGCAVLFLEFAKDINHIVQGCMDVYCLPLHLCGLAVFFTFFDSLHPTRTIGNFLYSTCMPGAICALLTPDWTYFPPFCYHSIVGFLVHTLLPAYPIMLLCGGDLRREAKRLPYCFAILVGLAIPIYFFDVRFHANYMFLIVPAPGSPLEWFASFLGIPGYLLGYLPMLFGAWLLLYLPRRKKHLAGPQDE